MLRGELKESTTLLYFYYSTTYYEKNALLLIAIAFTDFLLLADIVAVDGDTLTDP